MSAALIALGTNLPFAGVEGAALLGQALLALREEGLELLAVSGFWRTPPWPPGCAQPDFCNAVAEVGVGESGPHQLYETLRRVEARFGRERRERWGPRTLDLDILAMEGLVGVLDGIELPHPRLHDRHFVLAPLTEIAPEWRHPLLGQSASELLAALPAEPRGVRLDE